MPSTESLCPVYQRHFRWDHTVTYSGVSQAMDQENVAIYSKAQSLFGHSLCMHKSEGIPKLSLLFSGGMNFLLQGDPAPFCKCPRM